MKKSLLPLTIILLSVVFAYFLLTIDHEWGDDWASYLMQAIAVTKGETREFMIRNTFTMRESTHFLGPDAYPWGFPILLAPFTLACGPLNVFCLKFINLVFFALFLWVFYLFLARRLPHLEAILLLAVFAFSPVLLQFADFLISDLTFLFFSTLGLLLIDDMGRNVIPPYKGILLGLALFFAFFVRTNGILLLPTLFLAQAFTSFQTHPRPKPDWKWILTIGLIPYFVFGLLTFGLLAAFPAGEGSHIEHLAILSPKTLSENLSAYFSLPSYFFTDLPQSAIVYGFLLPFFLGGFLLHFKRDFPVTAYIILSYALFIVWPEQQGIRFLFPLLPFFVYFAYRGMTATFFALTERYQRAGLWLTRLFWLGIVLFFAGTILTRASDSLAHQRGPFGGPFDAIETEMFAFIRLDTPAEAIVSFYKPRAMRLFTDRDSLLIDSCDALPKADYIVLRKSRGAVDQILPTNVTTCNPSVSLTEVFDNEKYVIYLVAPQ